jgi:hypothetical protein
MSFNSASSRSFATIIGCPVILLFTFLSRTLRKVGTKGKKLNPAVRSRGSESAARR